MIKKKNKIIVVILIVIMIFNVCCPKSFADPTILDEDDLNRAMSEKTEDRGSLIDFGLGLGFYLIKIVVFLFAKMVHLITETVAGSGQSVTPETILFNKLELTNINFFDTQSSSLAFVNSLRTSVASWYYAMRTIAIISSLCVLIYIAIRMSISTIASEKAEYKRMLVDWAVGFGLIFVLHYIIVIVISGNNALVDIIGKTITVSSESGDKLKNFMSDVVIWGEVDFAKSLGSITIYVFLVCITLAFLIMYIKRLIVLAFLIIISPLITITYAIDRAGDSKSQALNAWLKEFIWTILVQPFHCIIYVVFVSVSFEALDAASLSGSILAIMCMLFIMQAEDIIKKIFGIQADNIGKMGGAMAMAAGGVMAAKRFAGSASSVAAGGAKKVLGKASSNSLKTKDGVGTGPQSNRSGLINTFSQNVANKWGSPAVQNKLNKLNNYLNNTKSGKVIKGFSKATGKYAKFSYAAGSRLFGTAVALPNAKGVEDAVAGYVAGAALGNVLKGGAKWVGKKANLVERGRTQNAEANLTESYKKMKSENNYTRTQMKDEAKVLLKLDLDSEAVQNKLSETQKIFAANLQTMVSRLEKSGEDTNTDNVLGKVKLKEDEL